MCVRGWDENTASLVSLRTGARLHQSESLQRSRNREIAQTLHLLLFQMQLFPCHKNVQISEIMRLFFITDEGRWTWEINLRVKTLFARPWPWLQFRQSKVLFVIVIWSHQWVSKSGSMSVNILGLIWQTGYEWDWDASTASPLIILSLRSEPLQALDWLSYPLAHSLDNLLSIAVLLVFLDNLLQLRCNYCRCSGRTSLSVSSWEASWLTPFWSTPSKCRCKNDINDFILRGLSHQVPKYLWKTNQG